MLAEWTGLKGRLNEKSRRRNEFAHLAVRFYPHEKRGNEKIKLGPSTFDVRCFPAMPTGQLRLTDIVEITSRFDALAVELCEYAQRIRETARKAAELWK